MSNKVLIQFDGGSRGNPGLSGAGAIIFEGDKEVASTSVFVGNYETNNYAEYVGIIEGLLLASDLDYKHVDVQGDSMLVLNQVSGKWKCKSGNLIPLLQEAQQIVRDCFMSVNFIHIPRKYNSDADRLANKAMDNYM